jgi:beta-propeller uncharacterized protein DUF5122
MKKLQALLGVAVALGVAAVAAVPAPADRGSYLNWHVHDGGSGTDANALVHRGVGVLLGGRSERSGRGLRCGSSAEAPTRRSHSDIALARYLPDGRPDPTFGSGGKVVTDVGPFDGVAAIALQPDGKVIAAATTGRGPGSTILRYSLRGRLDPTLGAPAKK